MKIPFDIKFRPQIESGEYKVVTGDDRPVRIISWDKKTYGGRTDIVALVPTSQGDTETVQLYSPDGTLISSSRNEKFKLFIITPEPELSEFEQEVRVCVTKNLTTHIKDRNGMEISSTVFIDDETAKKMAAELLELAKKELCKGCAANLKGYIKGRKDALKEMEGNRVYKYEGPTTPAFWPPCHYGGECTNPFHDCINCHRQSTDGISTTTGTSTAKLEG
ncbi:MAG: hypothetical protein J5382_10125 [Bacteroidales bacterium]|nr:hypothetical protein [Bacteroidales bacterium]